jgi:hypothetical protein
MKVLVEWIAHSGLPWRPEIIPSGPGERCGAGNACCKIWAFGIIPLRLPTILKRVLAVVVLSLCVLYAADYLSVRFRIPGHREPLGTVKVQVNYAVKQKDGKTEFYFNPPQDRTCVNSIFPHMGYSPCWYLRRQSNQQINM